MQKSERKSSQSTQQKNKEKVGLIESRMSHWCRIMDSIFRPGITTKRRVEFVNDVESLAGRYICIEVTICEEAFLYDKVSRVKLCKGMGIFTALGIHLVVCAVWGGRIAMQKLEMSSHPLRSQFDGPLFI
jgi:hypothetical protein